MRVFVVTPPAPVVSLKEAKAHLKVEHGDEDVLIEAFVAAATGHIDGPEGWLGRAIGVQQIEVRGDLFRSDPIRLPYSPVIDIVSAQFQDSAGAWQTLTTAAYEVRGDQIGTAWGTSWPAVRVYRGAAETVRIRYRAGYTTLPPAIRAAILLMVGDLYRNRAGTWTGQAAGKVEMSTTVEALLQPFRIYA